MFREAIAAENSTIFYPLVQELNTNEALEVEGKTDERLFKFAIDFALKNHYISSDQVPFIELALGIHKHAAQIQSYYQFYETAVLPFLGTKPTEEKCPTWLHYSGKVSCDTDSVFALETKKNKKDELILPIDRIVGDNQDAPLAVLYTDLVDPKFALFHQHLYSSALAGKIRYVVRYKPVVGAAKQQLTGYGAEVYIKRTDYLVIDDRDSKGKSSEDELKEDVSKDGDKESSDSSTLKSDSEGATISKGALGTLGFRAARFILNNQNKFEALVNVSLDFPKYSHAISELSPDRMVFSELSEAGLRPGSNALYINGAPIDNVKDDVFSIVKVIDRERKFMDQFKKIGIPSKTALDLVLAESEEAVAEENVRYDYRSPSIIWFNDLAKDERYSRWTKNVEGFLRQNGQQLFSPVRHNAHTLLYALDISQPAQFSKLADLINLISRGIPIQIGVIPLISSKESEEQARELLHLRADQGGEVAAAYLSALMENNPHKAVFNGLAKPGHANPLNTEEIDTLIAEAKAFQKRLDLDKSAPTLFTNGIMTTLNQRWFYQINDIVRNDNDAVRKHIMAKKVKGDIQLKDLLLEEARAGRNSLINPSDQNLIEYFDVSKLYSSKLQYYSLMSSAAATIEESDQLTTIWIIGNADEQFVRQVDQAAKFLQETESKVKINIAPYIKSDATPLQVKVAEKFAASLAGLNDAKSAVISLSHIVNSLADGSFEEAAGESATSTNDDAILRANFGLLDTLSSGLTLLSGGRILTLEDRIFSQADMEMLYEVDFRDRIEPILDAAEEKEVPLTSASDPFAFQDSLVALTLLVKFNYEAKNSFFLGQAAKRLDTQGLPFEHSTFELKNNADTASLFITAFLDPLSEKGQVYTTLLQTLSKLPQVHAKVILAPLAGLDNIPLKRFYRVNFPSAPTFDKSGARASDIISFNDLPQSTLLNMDIVVPSAWVALPDLSKHDLENIVLDKISDDALEAGYILKHLLLEGHAIDKTLNQAPRGMALELGTLSSPGLTDTRVMANLGYLQLKASPGLWVLNLKDGRSKEIFELNSLGLTDANSMSDSSYVFITDMNGLTIYPSVTRKPGTERQNVLEEADAGTLKGILKNTWKKWGGSKQVAEKKNADINIFTVASGHLYERFVGIMTISVMKHTDHTVKFWLIENFLSPSFKQFLPHLAAKYGFEYELITYKWPSWLRPQTEKQRTIWGYKILFLDVIFPQSLEKVIFVDADQIVRTDMMDLNEIDLQGAPYGFTPMCDSREEIEGFRFWKQGYWKTFLGDYKYHISALYVVDLVQFRRLAAGDQLRQHYQMLSADPNSLSNLDQDLPNHLQKELPIFSLPQEWLWCETWCSDESLKTARTIDLCNNPMTKEPKLDRARRQVPEWTVYDNLVAELAAEVEEKENKTQAKPVEVVEETVVQDQQVLDDDSDDIYDEL